MFTSIKKYYSKIAFILLAVIIFPMANSFCFQDLAGSFVEIDDCGVEPMDMGMVEHAEKSLPSNNDDSLLPCCVDNSHPSIITSFQSSEIEKFSPAVFVSDLEILKITYKNVLYIQPIISPPKLLAVKTTILRL